MLKLWKTFHLYDPMLTHVDSYHTPKLHPHFTYTTFPQLPLSILCYQNQESKEACRPWKWKSGPRIWNVVYEEVMCYRSASLLALKSHHFIPTNTTEAPSIRGSPSLRALMTLCPSLLLGSFTSFF